LEDEVGHDGRGESGSQFLSEPVFEA
jgi:hypothetical protein